MFELGNFFWSSSENSEHIYVKVKVLKFRATFFLLFNKLFTFYRQNSSLQVKKNRYVEAVLKFFVGLINKMSKKDHFFALH